MSSKAELQARFNQTNVTKTNNLYSQTRVFQELQMFMDYKIRKQLKTFTLMVLCNGERTKFMVDNHMQNAFSNMSLEEQVQLYEKTIRNALQIQSKEGQQKQSRVQIDLGEDPDDVDLRKEPVRFRIEVEKGFHSWQQIYITIDFFKVSSEEMQFDLRNYLIRRSKKKDRQCYVLEAIHQSSPKIVRFCFLTNSDLKQYLPLFKNLIDKGYKEMIQRMYNVQVKNKDYYEKSSFQKRKRSPIKDITSQQFTNEKKNQEVMRKVQIGTVPRDIPLRRTDSRIVEEIIKEPEDQEFSLQLNQIVIQQNDKYEQFQQTQQYRYRQQERWYKNVFSIMFPSYQLDQMDNFQMYKIAASDEQTQCFIFQHNEDPLIFKLELIMTLPAQIVVRALTNVPLYKHWHPEMVQGELKLSISSQNSAICYQKHKQYSKWYRQRDYLYLRHVFKLGQEYFIADKSIQNFNFIPFTTIHRGKIVSQITKVTPSLSGSKLIIECRFDHGGLLNRSHADELTIRYLRGFERLESYFKKNDFQDKLKPYFNLDWRIKEITSQDVSFAPKKTNNFEVADSEFSEAAVSGINDSDIFYSIKDESEKEQQDERELKMSVHELEQMELQQQKSIRQVLLEENEAIKVDEEGLVILPKAYLTVRHPQGIVESAERKKITPKHDNILLRDVFKLLDSGGMQLVNKKMIQAQDSVLPFLMSTLKKNIFSGKGALNISLPVTIFNCDSQLSRYALSSCCAPEFLQEAAKLTNPVQRMKLAIIFGLSHSLLFVDMEKPFNPILGQSFQCFIAGCPFYAEQISHHPPITSILMYGRGYRMYANLEATVKIHMNSADGINLGWYHIVFDDGQQICFQTPPAEFSGFTMGDRKFQFVQKGYYYDHDNNLYSQMHFQDQAGVFSGNKWKYRDQVQAEILSVKSEFLEKFLKNFDIKKIAPSKSDILENHGKIQGRWPLDIKLDGKKIYNINQNLPYEMIPYQFPLNSNTNYREDLYYRRMQDLSRSQSEKQRLENVQRRDRKLREKYNGSQH